METVVICGMEWVVTSRRPGGWASLRLCSQPLHVAGMWRIDGGVGVYYCGAYGPVRRAWFGTSTECAAWVAGRMAA